MTPESRKTAGNIIKQNCGSCCHNTVCCYKTTFEGVVKVAVHEVQGFDYLTEVNVKCKNHMFTGGTTFEISNRKDGEGDER